MTPLIIQHCEIKNTKSELGCRLLSTVIDVALPVSLLVVGILAKFSVLPMSPAASFGLLGSGSFLSLLSIGSWGKFIYQKRQNTPSSSSTLAPKSKSSTTSWEEKIYCCINGQKEKLLEKIKNKPSTASPYACILFFSATGHQADMFFAPSDGKFRNPAYSEIMKVTGDFIIFVCPEDEEAYKRWMIQGWFNTLNSSQKELQNFVSQKNPQVHIFTVVESVTFNSWVKGESSSPPDLVEKALGF